MSQLPILYSFRRCPYAIRARLAIAYSKTPVELREIVFRDKPSSMLTASPKGTVPVLVFDDHHVLEESRDIIDWCLQQHDPDDLSLNNFPELMSNALQLIEHNDGEFKQHLDHYKYADRYPQHDIPYYRKQGEVFLQLLDQRLQQQSFLIHGRMSIADIAIFPFIRQFAHVDKHWFEQTPYAALQQWLHTFLQSPLFLSVMTKYSPWQSTEQSIYFP